MSDEAIFIELESRVKILRKRKPDFLQFFDVIEMEVEEDLERKLLDELI
ncbi:hypothetical protein [Candidatus Korarchaeum cryptofilum]|uniref:Uncharacterized protein n=1 Tax=Korarchaeum cryptofilum (strain OPF8) TaxID=374847 RepID=B1L451_KORCO|nr:hypothetical protein [Candidatus Korarchaeum cryptofilum]ACB07230.1 conserved hypothetical protein [Candidatus Korarchaeum cryptofilum OPF8]